MVSSNDFKIHPSQLHRLMGNYKSHLLTPSQVEKKKFLEDKRDGKISGKRGVLKITDLDSKLLDELSEEKEPILSQGAKTYLEEWFKYQIYGDRIDINTKEIKKGRSNEKQGISMINQYFGVFLSYNETRDENHDYSWEIDARDLEYVYDIKNSFTSKTLPIFKDNVDLVYWWQGQAYMFLEQIYKYRLCYVLTNATESYLTSLTYSDEDGYVNFEEVYAKYEKQLSYDDVDLKYKVKVFEFEFDKEAWSYVDNVLKMSREYIDTLILKTGWD